MGQPDAVEVNQVVEKAIANPHDFVLKPQKEGGGNNFFDEELKAYLQDPSKRDELSTYIIMERINPPTIKAWMLRNGAINTCQSLSEIGIYSCLFMKTSPDSFPEMVQNRNMGTLLRTKGSHSNEGGVNAGFAVIDSPFFVDTDQFFEDKETVKPTVDL